MYRGGMGNSEGLSNLPEVTRQLRGRARTHIQTSFQSGGCLSLSLPSPKSGCPLAYYGNDGQGVERGQARLGPLSSRQVFPEAIAWLGAGHTAGAP